MSSREKILQQVEMNQPPLVALPVIDIAVEPKDHVLEFRKKLETLHVDVHEINDLQEVRSFIQTVANENDRLVTTIKALEDIAVYLNNELIDGHSLENVEIAILPAHFGVAENGAVWITEDIVHYRVLPFIAQQLAIVVDRKNIIANMHQAYDRIEGAAYGFAAFIAGPSKTADIEQSLVLGAHGPKSMMVFILG